MAEQHESVAKVRELIADVEHAMLVTTAPDGRLVSRPMAAQGVEEDGDLWFFTDDRARKVEHVRANPVVNVAFSSNGAWVSVAGRAEVVHDPARAKQLWNREVEAWFPDGPTGSNLALLRVEAESAEYWDAPGTRTATAVSWIKSKATGRPLEGDNETVDL